MNGDFIKSIYLLVFIMKSIYSQDCDRYSSTAILQNDFNIKWNCNYSGSRWSSSRENHYNWCEKNNKSNLISQIAYRTQKLCECSLGNQELETSSLIINSNPPGAQVQIIRNGCDENGKDVVIRTVGTTPVTSTIQLRDISIPKGGEVATIMVNVSLPGYLLNTQVINFNYQGPLPGIKYEINANLETIESFNQRYSKRSRNR